jgi:acetyl-CoA C-acetyltransferase
MTNKNDVFVLSAVRTAVGTYGGSLKSTGPAELSARVTAEALKRSGLAAEDIQHSVFGNVVQTEPQDLYLGRVAAIKAGLPVATPAFTLNRLCGSGLQAIVSAAQLIMLGDAETAVAGGAENMSMSPYWSTGMRWGQRMGDGKMIDIMNAALHDPFHNIHMGVTAENVAEKFKITREEQDAYAVLSHRRAANAVKEGYFKGQIHPIEVKAGKKVSVFDTDEHFRPDAKVEDLARLATVFKPGGTVTAGNASGLNDGAAAVILADEKYAAKKNLKPVARLVAYAHAGVAPELMGIGPVPAVQKVMAKAGLKIADMAVIEANEAFAAQALAVMKELDLPKDRTNPNGSGISLGHPIGATGCIITVKAIHELHRIGGKYALVTMCIGGGQGIAAIFERL